MHWLGRVSMPKYLKSSRQVALKLTWNNILISRFWNIKTFSFTEELPPHTSIMPYDNTERMLALKINFRVLMSL